MAGIRSFVPSSPALRRPLRGAESGSPEGRLRADARAPWARSREDPRVVDGVKAWWGHARSQSTQERERIHLDRYRSVGVCLLQCDAYQAVGTLLHSLLRNRRTQDVAQQSLAALGVEPAGACPPRGGFALAACKVNPSSDAQSGLS